MKKFLFNSTLFLVALATSSFAYAQEQDSMVYFECNFDKGIPAEFSLYDLDQQTLHFSMIQGGIKQGEAWARKKETGTQNYYAVSACRYKEIEGVELKPSDDWLITPAIWVRGKEANLSWISRSFKSLLKVGASYEVLISTTGNTPQDFTQPAIFSTPEETLDKWVEHNIDLSAYEGQHIYIAFHNNSAQGDFIGIDNLSVTGHRGVGFMESTNSTHIFGTNTLDVSLAITSFSDEPITDMTLYYRHNDQTVTSTLSQLNINKYEVFNYTFDTPIHIAYSDTAHYCIGAIVNGVQQDEIVCSTTAFFFEPTRKVVVEEGTGMWCQYCPTGIVAMEILQEKYPEQFIGMAVHVQDLMECYDHFNAVGFPDGLPSCWVNRKYYGNPMEIVEIDGVKQYVTTNGGMETYFLKELDVVSPIDIQLSNITYQDQTVTHNVIVRSAIDVDNVNYQLAIVVVEDNVWKNGYYQKNSYSGGDVLLNGWEEKPGHITDIEFDHVSRSYQSFDDVIPATLVAGEEYSHTFSYQLSNILNPDNTKIVAMVIDTTDGSIVNANESNSLTAIDATLAAQDARCYTANGNIYFNLPSSSPALIAIYDLAGSLVASHSIDNSTAHIVAPNAGAYILTITQDNITSAHKVVVR